MARSDSSGSDRSSRKHSKSKKRSRRSSRSNSSSNDDRDSKSRKLKSDRKRSRSRERKRSRSRERRKSRSRSRDRRRSRSRSRDRKKNRSRDRKKSRSRSSDRNGHSRSHSRRGSRSRSREKSRKSEKSKSPLKQNFSVRGDGIVSLNNPPPSKWDARPGEATLDDDSLSLKDKVKLLTGDIDTVIVPTADEISKIENQNFIQEKFSSTYIDPSNQPKQKKKKKKNKHKNGQTAFLTEKKVETIVIQEEKMELISHENAMFGVSEDTLHVSRFSGRLDGKRKEELKTIRQSDDLMFGAIFYDDPDVRMKRWIKKLETMRARLSEKQNIV